MISVSKASFVLFLYVLFGAKCQENDNVTTLSGENVTEVEATWTEVSSEANVTFLLDDSTVTESQDRSAAERGEQNSTDSLTNTSFMTTAFSFSTAEAVGDLATPFPTEATESENADDTEPSQSNRQIRRNWKYNGSAYPKPEFSAPPFLKAGLGRPAQQQQQQQPQELSVRSNNTRVEFLSADCYNNYMKIDVRFNGSFHGLIYSSGYANDADCLYVNGTGATKYQFVVRLNRCGTVGKQADTLSYPGVPGEVKGRLRERLQQEFLWNSITVQYNPIIEEEQDEQLKVTCEYGNDIWKTVTFPLINVKVSTGSPMSFTLSPPQCQMEILQGYGTAGLRIGGPVIVGDPLTLTIQMKSVSAGFDIAVSNCVAHNGGQMRLQLIDINGCVLNDKLMSRFRGYNHLGDYGEEVTLYSYVKAFRFTGSPALYLECDVRMCHGTCPPQRCYWRSLSKRSLKSSHENGNGSRSLPADTPVISESISLVQALQVRQESIPDLTQKQIMSAESVPQVCLRTAAFGSLFVFLSLVTATSTILSCIMCRRLSVREKNTPILA